MSLTPDLSKLIRGGTRKVKKTEVAGPYRSQSSEPKIRASSTKSEHRRVRVSSPPARATASRRGRPAPLRTPSLERTFHQAERQAAGVARQKQRVKQAEHKALGTLRRAVRRVPPDPQTAVEQARYSGVAMNESQRKTFKALHGEKALAKVDKARLEHIAEHEGLKEDPIAELAISTLATAGVGAGAKAIGAAAKSALAARAASELASTEATVGAKVAEGGLKATLKRSAASKIEDVRTAPARAAQRVRTAPERAVKGAREAPAKVKRAATTSEGRREAAAATARSARRHPVRSGYGAAAASPVPLPGEADKRARAAAEGAFKAVTEHPTETLRTTARALPAAITGPAALGEAAVLSAVHRNPEYLEKTASAQAKGLGAIVGHTFSGNTKEAEEAFRKEGAGALITPLPAITRLKAYERGRGTLREAANAARGAVAKRSGWANRRVRHGPKGSKPPVFGVAARRAERKKAAMLHQRNYNPQRLVSSKHEKAMLEALAKSPKNSHVALQTVAEYGVRDPHGAELLRREGPGDRHLLKALDYMDAHPELWKSKEFEKAIAAHQRNVESLPAAEVGKGERARLMPQGDLLNIPRPGMRVPHVRRQELGGAKTWPEVVSRVDRLKQGHAENLRFAKKQVKIARSGVEQALKTRRRLQSRASRLQGNAKERAKQDLARADASYKLAKRRQDEAKATLKATVVDGNKLAELRKEGVARSRETLKNEARYDSRLLHEYAGEVEAARAQAGLARAIYTPHTAGEKGSGLENRFPTPVGRKEHMRLGNYAKADNLDRSLEGLVHSMRGAHERAAGKKFGRDLADEKLPFTIDGQQRYVIHDHKEWEAITQPKSAENPNGGQYDSKSVGRLAIREVKNAIDDPFMSEAERSGALDALLKDAEEGRTKGSAPSILLPRELIAEARAQIHPEHSPITKAMNSVARVANRTILGTNPAWALAQVAAEGIPLLMAKPSLLVKGPGLLRELRRYEREHPDEAAALQATAGAAPHSAPAAYTPLDQATPQTFAEGAKALTRGKTARTALSIGTLRALGEFDRGRQNAYRTVLLAAEADKQFRSWHSSLTSLFDHQARLSQRFKSREELWNWLSKDPKGKAEAARLGNYVDNIQGNWTAFTHYERAYAPFTIFYPFLRYSLRWTLWTFPKTHPITATLAYMLGQANANQLEAIVGGKLTNPIGYAFPVYATPTNEKQVSELRKRGVPGARAKLISERAVMPGGSRISPGQSSLTQALATGNPAQVLSSANPFVGAGITALTGIEPLSGEQSGLPRGEAAINQLLSMPAPLRLAGMKLGGQSVASQAYEKYDPNKKARSFLLPALPQSGERFADTEALSKAFAKKYGEGHVPGPFDSKLVRDLLYGGPNGTPQPHLLPKVLKQIHESEAAGDFTQAVEQPFYGKSKAFSAQQKKLLEAVENAWKTRPKSQRKSRGSSKGIGGGSGGGIGGYSLSGGSIGGPGGSSSGGGIGGHSIGGKIGGAG